MVAVVYAGGACPTAVVVIVSRLWWRGLSSGNGKGEEIFTDLATHLLELQLRAILDTAREAHPYPHTHTQPNYGRVEEKRMEGEEMVTWSVVIERPHPGDLNGAYVTNIFLYTKYPKHKSREILTKQHLICVRVRAVIS